MSSSRQTTGRRSALLTLCATVAGGLGIAAHKGCKTAMNNTPLPLSHDGDVRGTRESRLMPQQQPARILATDQAIYQLHPQGVRVVDPTSLAVRADVSLAGPLAIGRIGKDEAAVLAPHSQRGWLSILCITAQGSVTARHRAALSTAGVRVLPGAEPRELLILTTPGSRYTLDRFRLGSEELAYADADIKLDGDASRTLSAVEPGSAIYASAGRLVRLRLAGTNPADASEIIELPAHLRELRLLSAGGHSLWASDESGALVRMTLANPLPAPTVVGTGAALVYQLAALPTGEAAALLVGDSTGLGRSWKLAVFDEQGRERWQRPLPDPTSASELEQRHLSAAAGYVAVGGSHALRTFDLANGTPRS